MNANSKVVRKRKPLSTTKVEEINDNNNKIELNKKPDSIGDKLRRLRKEQAKSIQDIARALRIGEHYLRAIENMDRQGLPERVYSLGFVRSYACHLGLDPHSSLTQFKEEIYEDYQGEILSLPEPLSEASRANWKILVICFSLIGLVIFSWYKLTHKKQVQEPANTALAVKEIIENQEQPTIEQVEPEQAPTQNFIPSEKKLQAFLGTEQKLKGHHQKDSNISLIQDFQLFNLQNQMNESSEEKAP